VYKPSTVEVNEILEAVGEPVDKKLTNLV